MSERKRIRRAFRISLVIAALLALVTLPAIERDARQAVGTAAAQTHGDGYGDGQGDEHGTAATDGGTHGATTADGHGTTATGAHGTTATDTHGATAAHGADDTHAAAAHHDGPPELDHLFVMLGFPHGQLWLHGFVGPDQIFMLFYILILIVVAAVATRAMKRLPGSFQNGVEFVVEALHDFIVGILGPRGREFVPFLGTLFVFILLMNFSGLVPFLKAPTNNLSTTLALAVCVFLYVQATGIRQLGIVGYLDHMAGSPRDVVGFVLIPLMLPLHLVGELVKPVSLSLRLFGNITGEDVLLAVFVGLGVSLYGALHLPFADWLGIPLHAILYPLLLIFGFIQALVFTLLSTIYFYMMLPHEEHH